MITVYTFRPAWGLPSPSPFGLKLETWLRFAGIPYQCEYVQRMTDSPKKTVPWIRDQDRVMADTGFILEYLNEKHGHPLADGLSAEQVAAGHAIRRMFEENLARIGGYTRWLVEANWPETREVGFGAMEEPWKSEISAKAREKIREDMILHGIGRHTPDEVQHIGLQDVKAVEMLLGDKPFVLDDRPRDVDATVFGILAQYIVPPLECAISDYARASVPLSGYCQRILGTYFPEYAPE